MGIGIEKRLLALSLLPQRLRRAVMERRYAREIEETGEAELPYLRHILNYGDLAVDVGCNLGVYTYEMSRISGRVIAFEPNPLLARLVRSLGLDGVEVRQVAVSDKVQQTQLFVPEGPRCAHPPRAMASGSISRPSGLTKSRETFGL
jgi:hypothetical protein